MLKHTVAAFGIAALGAVATTGAGNAALLPQAMAKSPAQMGGMQIAACNPCSAAPCNPCAPRPNPCAAANPCAANPCAAANPCGANPCAANPCAAK